AAVPPRRWIARGQVGQVAGTQSARWQFVTEGQCGDQGTRDIRRSARREDVTEVPAPRAYLADLRMGCLLPVTRSHPELAVGIAEMEFDRLRAQEQRRGCRDRLARRSRRQAARLVGPLFPRVRRVLVGPHHPWQPT